MGPNKFLVRGMFVFLQSLCKFMYKSKVFQSETKIRNPKIKQPLVVAGGLSVRPDSWREESVTVFW